MLDKYSMLNGILGTNTLHNLNIEQGSDEYLIDTDGKKYIDLASGLWNVSLGYNNSLNKNIQEGFSDILSKNIPYLDMTSYYNELYSKVSNKLLDFIDNNHYKKVLYTNSGSESIELSLKIVNAIKQSKKILSFSESYHGTFYGGMSISGLSKEIVKEHLPNYDNKININIPKSNQEEIEFLEFVQNNINTLGAIFIEPVIGSGGIQFCSFSFYNKLLDLCAKNNVLTVFDEVATGFYKTGNTFFFKHLDYTPDIICLSKSINNGTLPAGTVIINEKVTSMLSGKTLKHMSTQNGNLLCLTSIDKTLDYYFKNHENLLNNTLNIENFSKELTNIYNKKARIMGSIVAIPIKQEYLSVILEDLKDKGILAYRFITPNESGITLFPHINIDIKMYKKTLNYILKTINKY